MVKGHATVLRPASSRDLLAMLAKASETLWELAGERHLEMKASGQGLWSRFWVIETREGQVIGYIGLEAMTWYSAELRVCILDSRFVGRGYGTDAVSTFTGFVFSRTSLRYLYLRVLKDNCTAVRCYKKCGFHTEAVLKAGGHGPHSDVLLMRLERE